MLLHAGVKKAQNVRNIARSKKTSSLLFHGTGTQNTKKVFTQSTLSQGAYLATALQFHVKFSPRHNGTFTP